ncbi:MAG: Haloacetate dehalogenase H-1 [Verrucomicrobia subdivision 3 bacterium]|nr:Haloacetate dehalogenase H-1 [Limisphaerales bacterium]MCS1416187.1 Haloacetate dehalogenase H-1 [Limisphaerales bacterium]
MPELARDRLVIAPDYPGYGESDHWPEEVQPAITDYADSMEEVIRHFGLEQLHLVGHHTGAMVAVELAQRHPQLVGKVINISAPILNEQEVQYLHDYFATIPLDQEGTRFQTMWQRVLKFRGPGMTLEMAAASLADNLRGGERYEDGHRAAFNHSHTYAETLARIDQPVLVMNVCDDLFEPSKAGGQLLEERQARRLSRLGARLSRYLARRGRGGDACLPRLIPTLGYLGRALLLPGEWRVMSFYRRRRLIPAIALPSGHRRHQHRRHARPVGGSTGCGLQ